MLLLTDEYRERIKTAFEESVKEAIYLFGSEEEMQNRFGGAFHIADSYGSQGYTGIIGDPAKIPKLGKCVEFCQEKVRRMLENKLSSSWQTRNEYRNQWGGGVAFEDFSLGFSGFPELIDEAVCLRAAFRISPVRSGVIKLASYIAKISSNPYVEPLLAHTITV